jgi:tripartite-type tricarboxylate transporter receptor subunit TctC
MKLAAPLTTLALAISAALPATALADGYPNRTLRIVVGFAPGGNVDTPTRIVANRLSDVLGVPVVVENKPGAGGNIAADAVARAQPDGYTLLACGATSHGANSALFAKLPYDPIKDFAPVTMFGTVANVLVVHPSVPANTFAEFAAWAKADPARANVASSGNGTSQHLSIELLKSITGLPLTHIPYKGGAPAMNDLLGGQVPAMVAGMPTALPSIVAGRARAIAVTTPKRSTQLPNVPTLAEAGVPGYDVTNWVGLCVPAGVAKERVQKLYAAVQDVLKSAETDKSLKDIGYEPARVRPTELAEFIGREIPKWTKVVREAAIAPQ